MSHTYQNQCVFCSFQRVEIQLIPCGHFYHVKCIYPWPTRTCQNCNCNINEVKVIQPCYHKFVTLPPAIQSYRYHNLEELQSFGVLRRGRWSSEELAYGNLLRDLFCSNSLPLTNETRLPDFLGHMLQCSSVRLRTKIKTGKQVYHIRAETAISMAEFYHTRANMQKLSGLYEAFLKKVREDDILDSVITAYQTHRFWLRNFVKLYHNEYNISSLMPWQPSPTANQLPNQTTTISTDVLSSVLQCTNISMIPSIVSNMFSNGRPKHCYGIVTSIFTKEILFMTSQLLNFIKSIPEMEEFKGGSLHDLEKAFGNMSELTSCLSQIPTITDESNISDPNQPNRCSISQHTIILPNKIMSDYVRCHAMVGINPLTGISIASLIFEEINIMDQDLYDTSKTKRRRTIKARVTSSTTYASNSTTSDTSDFSDDELSPANQAQPNPSDRNISNIQMPQAMMKSDPEYITASQPYPSNSSYGMNMNQQYQLDPVMDEFHMFYLEDPDALLQYVNDAVGNMNSIPRTISSSMLYNSSSISRTTSFMDAADDVLKALCETDDLSPSPFASSPITPKNVPIFHRNTNNQGKPVFSRNIGDLGHRTFNMRPSTGEIYVLSDSFTTNEEESVVGSSYSTTDPSETFSDESTGTDRISSERSSEIEMKLPQSNETNYKTSFQRRRQGQETYGMFVRSPREVAEEFGPSILGEIYDSSATEEGIVPHLPSHGNIIEYGKPVLIASMDTYINVQPVSNVQSLSLIHPSYTRISPSNPSNGSDASTNTSTINSRPIKDEQIKANDDKKRRSSATDEDHTPRVGTRPRPITPKPMESNQSLSLVSQTSPPNRSRAFLPSIKLNSVTVDAALKSLLRYVPFDLIEIWVPVPTQLNGDNRSIPLYFAGSTSTSTSLASWSSYSRSFVFHENVGLPGRVSVGHQAEAFNDIASLPKNTYLRVEGAQKLGIHASVGIPVHAGKVSNDTLELVSSNNRDRVNDKYPQAVVVFYSRNVFEPKKDLIHYLTDVMKDLNVNASASVKENQLEDYMRNTSLP